MSTKEDVRDWSYVHERLDPLGFGSDTNVVPYTWNKVDGTAVTERHLLFEPDAEGNLLINYYQPDGAKATYRRGENSPVRHYQVTRWRIPKVRPDGAIEKYKHPAGAGTIPWFSANTIEAYRNGKHIPTLVMVEGVIKAYAVSLHGVHMVGLPGIHNLKDKSTGTLHPDLLKVMKVCQPNEVVFLHDGDARALSTKWPENTEVDLYTRPNSFYTSARNMGELLKDYARQFGFRTYYMHVVSDSIATPPKTEPPKGVDDLLQVYQEVKVLEAAYRPSKDAEPVLPAPEERERLRAEAIREVVEDLVSFSRPPRFFERRDLDRPDRLRDYFHLRSAETFYAAHQERIGDKEFVYDGTKYQWDETEKQLKIKVPSTAKKYVRVGTTYYKYIKVRNPHSNQLEEVLAPWSKPEIKQDEGAHFLNHVPKYDSFVNWPDHVAYRPVIDNCLNSYGRFLHTPDPDAEPPTSTLRFLQHIFGGGVARTVHPINDGKDGKPLEYLEVKELELGLDYLKLMLERPTQILPILCLVSKKRGTGKTTFFDWLQLLFGSNVTQIGARDLEGDFNAHYASKLAIIIDEALVSKQESVEKLKHLSTSKMIMVNNKGVAQYPQAFFGKFLLGSNNVHTFIRTDDDEVRFWVRDVPPIPADMLDTELFSKMVDELPSFLAYLMARPMACPVKYHRSWFHPPLLHTEALLSVRKHSAPTAKRIIEGWIRGMFWAMPDCDTILMTADNVKKEMFAGQRMDDKYLREILREELGLHTYQNAKGEPATTPYSYWRFAEKKDGDNVETVLQEVKFKQSARPYVFPRRKFISEDEEKQLVRELVPPELRKQVAAAAKGEVPEDLPF
ncbi:MAG: DUF3854 domain-containing protein [Flavobacteriales bacterium]|nr:DUF3854 domain-containing protein [Flavobacteriales bacterium]